MNGLTSEITLFVLMLIVVVLLSKTTFPELVQDVAVIEEIKRVARNIRVLSFIE
jgi:Sec-independent protein translocase protein TatA